MDVTTTILAENLEAQPLIERFSPHILHRNRKEQSFSFSSKGHAEQMTAWLAFLRGAAEHPLPYEQSRVSMLLTFAALESIQKARSVELAL